MPEAPAEQQLGERYLKSWDALGKLLEEGKSWSGRERNVLYLNTRDGRFTDVSTLAGWAHPTDSRALGFTDWDGDGDLDVWQANRSGPRLRFLLNQHQKDDSTGFLGLKLTGRRCNWDAIGARVTVALADGRQLIKTLRAGEGYLSQSSKTMHFGIPREGAIREVTVAWPGGAPESTSALEPGKTYQWIQGEAPQEVANLRAALPSVSAAFAEEKTVLRARVVPHAKLPLPELPVKEMKRGEIVDLSTLGQETVMVLWASWCAPCLEELRVLKREATRLKEAGVRVVLVNVDETPMEAEEAAPEFLQTAGTPEFLDAIDIAQRILVGRERPAALPMSCLADGQGRLVTLYKGAVEVDQLLQDRALCHVPDGSFRDHAVPFRGRWLIKAMPLDLLSLPNRLMELGRTRAAHRYLERHVTGNTLPKQAADLPSLALTMEGVSQAYASLGQQFARENDLSHATHALVRALQYVPRNLEARAELAVVYERNGALDQAADQLRQVLKLSPSHLPAMNSLAWILATAPKAEWRNAEEAERLALQVCQATQYRMAEPMDTLAAALAAKGDFVQAVSILERALPMAETELPASVLAEVKKRLALYRSGRPYTAP